MSPRRKTEGNPAPNTPDADKPAAPKTQRGSRARQAAEEEAREREALLEAVASGLDDVLPGLELVDRDLVFDEGGRADLACVDESGRLVLVLLAEGDVNHVAVVAMDTVSYAQRHLALLQTHLGVSLSESGGPRVILLAPNGGDVLLRRIAPLCDLGLEVFGLRTIQSAKGERSYLVQLGPNGEEVPARTSRLDAFLDRLSPPVVDLVRNLVQRMRRLDDRLVVEARGRVVTWRLGERAIARLETSPRGVFARIEPAGPDRSIASEADADGFLEEAMEVLVGGVRVAPKPRIVAPVEPPSESQGQAAKVDLDEPILTPEELEAFRS